ncbi:putative duf1752-domain-containing protein [Erysiphe neolycopersici]|uniref:Putative duf1752-domain-containing protein n=1 Tax=Erysiphe neolycopersici TaxID=212602 RepID=A0A420HVS7_9PEZI|nr:putative duf1752-domain-containing protein [Erysiphe neolycopersici]
MSSRLLDKPVLRVDVAAIQQVDLRNMESLRRMWTVFTHCASVLEEGRRLENLSWRVWTRETLCSDPTSHTATSKNYIASSSSLRSVIETQPIVQDSSSYPRLNCVPRHTTSDELEKMVTTITEKKELQPLPEFTPPRAVKLFPEVGFTKPASPEKLVSPAVQPKTSCTNVVRGFSPVQMVRTDSSRRFDVNPSSIPTADITAAAPCQNNQPKAKTIFALGGSSEDSFEPCLSTRVSSREEIEKSCHKKNAIFSFGASSNEDEILPGNIDGTVTNIEPASKASLRRPTTFQEEVARRTILEEAIIDDVFESDEEDIVDESAIDDVDDSSEWEDSVEGSGHASVEEKNYFQRVDSKANLNSRRSLITTMLHQQDRMNALMNEAMKSKSASTLHPKLAITTSRESSETTLSNAPHLSGKDFGHTPETSHPNAKPIVRSGHFSQQLALSPRTTRRNMLASELTVSLRQHLLWERKQKSQTTSAAIKRRHTSQDVAHLRQYPEVSYTTKDEKNPGWENCYDGSLSEYNARGW